MGISSISGVAGFRLDSNSQIATVLGHASSIDSATAKNSYPSLLKNLDTSLTPNTASSVVDRLDSV